MGRPRVAPAEPTRRVTIRIPLSMYRDVERLGSAGGDHAGAISRGLRWLWKRTYSKSGPKGFQSPVVELRRRYYERMLDELKRLRKERRVFAKATKGENKR